MKISLKGVRGSIPTTGAETSIYGGNTSCTVVTEDNWLLVVDAGSGLQKVSTDQFSVKRVDILLTHLHFDHIQGLGFFPALFDASTEVHIWGPASATQSLHSRLSRYLSPPLFPVLIRDLPCAIVMHDIENTDFEIGPFKIKSQYVIHPGPTVGFRIENHRSTFVYIPDHEPALGLKGLPKDKKWMSGFDLAIGADLLLHDAQYTEEEYHQKVGWGHSSMEDAVRFGEMAGVQRLLLAHHDPTHKDSMLEEHFKVLQHKFPGLSMKYEFAKEGLEIEL
ncbi:MAG: MBL fold metallo-hydrolase [Bacteroidota bacterium]|nr:MBL fold metallo-hydrolase [Ferruginibacter sp.]